MQSGYQFHIKKGESTKEYAYSQIMNSPIRDTMEDKYIALDNFPNNGFGMFGILDGHGGKEASQFCSNAIPHIFDKELQKNFPNIKLAFEKTFQKTDHRLKQVGAMDSGTTCCIAVILKQQQRKTCYLANLGDTRAVLSKQGAAQRMTVDHKSSNPSEQQRVKKEGGRILRDRLAGQLAITRALGDFEFKSDGLSNIPEIDSFEITKKTNFLIIASDGLWDVCDDQKAVDICGKLQNAAKMANSLVEYAIENNSRDNISVLILKFN